MKSPKTTIAAIVGAIVSLISIFGIEVSTDVTLAIVTIAVFIVGFFAADEAPSEGNRQ